MIRNGKGERVSAKVLAQEILLGELEDSGRLWLLRNSDVVEDMSDREMGLLNDQLFKQFRRLAKLLGVTDVVRQQEEKPLSTTC